MNVEYLVVTVLMLLALLLPVPPFGVSVVEWVIEALKSYQAHSSLLLSIP